jgi:hypothetical protein
MKKRKDTVNRHIRVGPQDIASCQRTYLSFNNSKFVLESPAFNCCGEYKSFLPLHVFQKAYLLLVR